MEALETLVWVSLNAAAIAIRVAWVAFPIGFGAWLVIHNRRFSIGSLEHRRRLWKWDYSETEVKVGRGAAVVLGTLFVIVGLMEVVELLLGGW